jgi:hypothetical protein
MTTTLSKETQIGLNANTTNIDFVSGLRNRITDNARTNKVNWLCQENIMEFIYAPTPKFTDSFVQTINKNAERLGSSIEDRDNVINRLRKPRNKNVYFSSKAIQLSENIKLKQDLDINFFNQIPDNTMETFLIGNRFYRYWVIDKKAFIIHYKVWKKISEFDFESELDTKVYNDFMDKHGSREEVERHLSVDNILIFAIDFNEGISVEGINHEILSDFLRLLIFLRFGDVTINLVKSNSVTKLPSGDSMNNTSSKDITIVKANWNTISIRTEGFSVKAHFRLQPCGEGRTDRKLVFIDQFNKHGYIRKGQGIKQEIKVNA